MTTEEIRRISIGLIGMQVLELRVTDAAYQDLRGALEGDNPGWHTVPTQDSEVLVDLSKVTYLSLASQEHRVGF
jgi:hypothetical protein